MKLVVGIFLFLWCAAFVGCAQIKFEGEASPYTNRLPAIDKVEIQKVTGNIEVEKFVEKILLFYLLNQFNQYTIGTFRMKKTNQFIVSARLWFFR